MTESQLALRIENLSPVKKKITIQVPWDEAKKELEEITKKVAKTAQVKGFRTGRVPRPILEKKFGAYIREETVNSLVNRYYWEAVDEHKITPLSRPEIEEEGLKDNEPFSFSATVEVEPILDPTGYKGLKLVKKDVAATEEEINLRLKQVQEMYATMEEIDEDRPVKKGDYVSISFQGFLEGKPLDNMKADDYLLHVGAGLFVPGFEDQIVGMKKGEEKDFTVTFPADYLSNRQVAGKEVTFHVAIKGIKEKRLPPIDEEFVKNFDQYKSIEELKKAIAEAIESEKKGQAQKETREAIVNNLLAINEVPVPETLVERQVLYMMMDSHRYWSLRGMNPREASEIILSMKDMYREEAEKIVKTFLLMKSIAAKEDISVSEEEKDAFIKDLAQKRKVDYETLRKQMEEDGMTEQLGLELLTDKVFKFIETHSEFVESPQEGVS